MLNGVDSSVGDLDDLVEGDKGGLGRESRGRCMWSGDRSSITGQQVYVTCNSNKINLDGILQKDICLQCAIVM